MTYELVEYPLSSGLDEGTDPRRTPKFITVLNYQWSKQGLLEKRCGYAFIAPGTVPVVPVLGVVSVTITAAGSGYTNPTIIYGTGGGGSGFGALCSLSGGGAITGIIFLQSGSGYSFPPTALFFDGPGTGAAATLTLGPVDTGAILAQSYTIRVTADGATQTTDGSQVYNFTSDGWAPIGPLQNVLTYTSELPLSVQAPTAVVSQNATNWFVVECGGRLVWWTSAGPLVQDIDTGTIVPTNLGIHLLGGAARINGNVVTDGTQWVWFFSKATPGTASGMRYYPLHMSTPNPTETGVPIQGVSPGGAGTLGSSAVDYFDCIWNPVTQRLVTAYVVTGTNIITVSDWIWDPGQLTWSAGPVNDAYTIFSSPYTFAGLSVNTCNDGRYLLVWAWVNNTGVDFTGVDAACQGFGSFHVYSASTPNVSRSVVASSLSIVSTDGNNEISVAFTSADQSYHNAFGQITGSTLGIVTNCVHAFTCNRTGTVESTVCTNNTTLGSRLFARNSRPYALLYTNGGAAMVLADMTGVSTGNSIVQPNAQFTVSTPATIVSYVNPRVAYDANGLSGDLTATVPYSLPTAAFIGSDTWVLPATLAEEPGTSSLLRLQQCRFQFGAPVVAPSPMRGALIYPCSIPTIAGEGTRECQFMAPPIIAFHTTRATFGSLSAGNYTWVATYARIGEDGSTVESPPSAPFTLIGVSANDEVTIYVSSYNLGGVSRAPEFIILYRTQVNQGSVLYRCIADPFATRGATSLNETESNMNLIGVVDGAADTAIAANRQLYTGGGVFDNVCPPACSISAVVRDRIYLAGTPDGYSIYYSDAVTSIGTANFHDEQIIATSNSGRVTGVAELDANVLVFKEESVSIVYGTEGGNTGQGSTLSTPYELPTGGVGCISSGSIVYTDQGIMFQSRRGIELIDRKLTVSFVGAPVKDELAGHTIVATAIVPERYQVRFVLETGAALVLSTLNGEWSVFTYTSLPAGRIYDATTIDGTAYWCGGGYVMHETPGAYADNGHQIAASWRSGWFSLGQLESYRRYHTLQLLGQWNAETGVTIRIATDFANADNQVATWTSGEIAAIPGFDSNRLQLEITPVLQKAEAVQVAVSDNGPLDGTFTSGVSWNAISFEIATKPGKYRKLPTAASK